MARLDHLMTVLSQPRHIDTISRRVKGLVSDLEKLHETRRKLGDDRPLNVALSGGMTVVVGDIKDATTTTVLPPSTTDDSPPLPPDTIQKIDALFAILPRIDPLLPLTPHLLSRLRSLATLHSSAANFASDLASVKSEVHSLGEGEAGLKEVLTGLESSLEENDKKVRSNLGGLEERISSLIRRMDKLGV
jgi:nuclear migration protein JNM1